MVEQSPNLATFTHLLSVLSLIGILVVGILVLVLVYSSYTKRYIPFLDTISKYIFPLGFLVSFTGMSLSLVYSMIFGMVPCELCWVQRIFMYPLVFMFAYAWWKRDRAVLPYAFILSFVGLIVATYHHALQMGYNIYKPCSTAPFAADCSKPSFIEFGFVSFPFMAIVLFSFLIVLIISTWKSTVGRDINRHGK